MSFLSTFIESHLGVGSLDSKVWYIGLEPAGDGSMADTMQRVGSFMAQGAPETTNLRSDLIATGDTKWFHGNKPPTQPYWRRIAHLELVINGAEEVSIEDLRQYQSNVICSSGGPVLLEVSALPAKDVKHWNYGWTGMTELATRKTYFESGIIHRRVDRIIDLIKLMQPKLVLFCGTTYESWWSQIRVGAALGGVNTRLKRIPHPCAKGVTHAQWTKLAKNLRIELSEL